MKSFFAKYKRIIALATAVLVLILICTTAGVSTPRKSVDEIIDDIDTCSTPKGKILAHGIDVSRYQGTIDFKKVKSDGYSFVIIRVGTSKGGKDIKFEENYKKARAAGLDIGCYYYTYATTARQAKEEAFDVREYISGKTFTYPVFFDIEYEALESYDRIDENDAMINAFCKYIKRGGFYPGVYTSSSFYNNYIDKSTLGSRWDFWVASYRDNTHSYEGYNKSFSMWQYSSNGVVKGINARVDLDVSYVDYPNLISEFNSELENIPTKS
ncbi:MAG: glycoside hydrolase family 25 protein [Ruminococcus sp.]|nr:glycoside hydrolase family 25 protein [Ruminococcus sp.]